MITQQALMQQRQRRKRQADQLTIPLEQELSRSLHSEQYHALSVLREPIAQAIHAMRYEAYDITDGHCDVIVTAFQELLLAVKSCMAVFNSPDISAELRPYALVMKLSALHRILIDAQVMVGNVRGQCRYGRLATDPTGSYWHLRTCLRDVVRDYQSLLSILKQEMAVSQSQILATA
jgi:hypothetical protein